MAHTNGTVHVPQCNLEHLVREDCTGVCKPEQGVISEDCFEVGVQKQGVKYGLVAHDGESTVSVDDLDLLSDADFAHEGNGEHETGQNGLVVDWFVRQVVRFDACSSIQRTPFRLYFFLVSKFNLEKN